MADELPQLCKVDECRLIHGHKGNHEKHPTSAWNFMQEKDKNKIIKAGFATPRGGDKGAYQNHVLRNNRVIVPYEKLGSINLSNYRDGYVIRIFPDQFFESKGTPKKEFLDKTNTLEIGKNAFILYRTHKSLKDYPPLKSWQVCHLEKDGKPVNKRGKLVSDVGHYVLRTPSLGPIKGIVEGPPQGLFAPEYADEETNYLCKCVLAFLIVHTEGSPYISLQAQHLRAILREENLHDQGKFEFVGVLRHGLCCCPLCLRIIKYCELHEMLDYEEENGALENAGTQIEGATRSTIINLFHLEPMTYNYIKHIPKNVGWGHAVCNTRLGQRRCYSLDELQGMNLKIGVLREEGIDTFGWISKDYKFIRGHNGSVWIQVSEDTKEE